MREPYQRPRSSTWWLSRRSYLLFMLRELTSVFIAAFLILYLVQLWQLARGEDAYTAFLERLASPGWIIFSLLVLVAALYHSITWFNVTPKALVIRMGEERVPPLVIAGSHYAAWLVISVAIMWIVLGS